MNFITKGRIHYEVDYESLTHYELHNSASVELKTNDELKLFRKTLLNYAEFWLQQAHSVAPETQHNEIITMLFRKTGVSFMIIM